MIADVRVHYVIARIVRDGIDRAGVFAGVAANADFRVDQVLFENFGVHSSLPLQQAGEGWGESAGWAPRAHEIGDIVSGGQRLPTLPDIRLIKSDVIKIHGLTINTHHRWRNPVCEFTRFDHAMHE